MKWSFVIPNYNGVQLLENNLPSVLKSAKGHEVIVVDDASTDESVRLIKKKFKQVILVEQLQNKGFAATCNQGVKVAKGEFILLLNSDCTPAEDVLTALEKHFQDPNVFAVGCMELMKEGNRGKSIGKFHHGFLDHADAPDRLTGFTLWAFGAAAAYDKKKWLEVGGMDELYRPAYWEDIDLSYNAWKRGWKVIFEPNSKVYHDHESTNKIVFGKSKMKVMATKNQFLFVWKNITDTEYLLMHVLWIPVHIFIALVHGDWITLKGMWLAALQINEALSKRKEMKQYQKVSDSEIVKQFSV